MGALTESHVVVFAFAAGRANAVLVKVGNSGRYRTFVNDGILEKDSMGLLKALKNDEGFSKLKDVALDECAVFVGCFEGKVPALHEENAAKELEGADIIESLAGAATRVFIRVDVPVAGGGGECRRVTACGLTPPPPPVMR